MWKCVIIIYKFSVFVKYLNNSVYELLLFNLFIILLIYNYPLFSKLEAVRKIKAFENATNAEIEAPMKVYLAGAAFRKKKLLL